MSIQLTHPLSHFIQCLWAGGDVVLTTSSAPGPDDAARATPELLTLEAEYRRGLPGTPPAVHLAAAEWALTGLYRACQFLVYRELPEEQLRADLGRACPAAADPGVCYSVDLSFRFLPEVYRLTRAANANDPLLDGLRNWANTWPLSSVGISGLTPGPLDSFLCDACLRMIYVDRILACQDQSRLSDPRVADAVRAGLGGFRELSPTIYDAVQPAAQV